jgi:hypothetical protein
VRGVEGPAKEGDAASPVSTNIFAFLANNIHLATILAPV